MLNRILGRTNKQQAAEHARLQAERQKAVDRVDELNVEAERLEHDIRRAAIEFKPTTELRERVQAIDAEREDISIRIDAMDEALEASRAAGIEVEIEHINAEIEKENKKFAPIRRARDRAKVAYEKAEREFARAIQPHGNRVNSLANRRYELERELRLIAEAEVERAEAV